MPSVDAEAMLERELREAGIFGFVREVTFRGVFGYRRWRFDFADTARMVAIEVHGSTFSNGAHTQGVGFRDNRSKMNEALLCGWRVFEFTTEQVTQGHAILTMRRFVGTHPTALDFDCPADLDIMEAAERRADELRRKSRSKRVDVEATYRQAIAEVLEHATKGKQRTRGASRRRETGKGQAVNG
jgi:hypothetical protein